MFKNYKTIFKNLRDAQEQMWSASLGRTPGALYPSGLNLWQQKTLQNLNAWAGQAVQQSMELQREWLGLWMERASGKNLKPKSFAELNAEALRATQRWLDNQHRLWEQWMRLLKDSGGSNAIADFDEMEKTVQESVRKQIELLEDWSAMSKFESLSAKELSKLSSQIAKSMRKSIETQQQLWGLWFNDARDLGDASTAAAAPARPRKSVAASAAKSAAAPKTVSSSSPAEEDLKQISGIGPGLEKKLKAKGFTNLRQIATLTEAQIADLEKSVIRFSGRVEREAWVEQAKALLEQASAS
jgi:predicted flap endonuclease-1-like 5' DNA nuclease